MPNKSKAKKTKTKKVKKEKLGSSTIGNALGSDPSDYRFESYLPSKKDRILEFMEELINDVYDDTGDLNVAVMLDLVRQKQWLILEKMAELEKTSVEVAMKRLDSSSERLYTAIKNLVESSKIGE